VLSRGLLSGSTPAEHGDLRAFMPRFAGNNGAQNRLIVKRLGELAAQKSITVTQLMIAWALAKNQSLVPLIGARTRSQLQESLGALAVNLSPNEVTMIEQAAPESAVAGTRYDERQMRVLDSER